MCTCLTPHINHLLDWRYLDCLCKLWRDGNLSHGLPCHPAPHNCTQHTNYKKNTGRHTDKNMALLVCSRVGFRSDAINGAQQGRVSNTWPSNGTVRSSLKAIQRYVVHQVYMRCRRWECEISDRPALLESGSVGVQMKCPSSTSLHS